MEWLRNIAPIIFLARNHCRMSVFKDYVVSNKLWNYYENVGIWCGKIRMKCGCLIEWRHAVTPNREMQGSMLGESPTHKRCKRAILTLSPFFRII